MEINIEKVSRGRKTSVNKSCHYTSGKVCNFHKAKVTHFTKIWWNKTFLVKITLESGL